MPDPIFIIFYPNRADFMFYGKALALPLPTLD